MARGRSSVRWSVAARPLAGALALALACGLEPAPQQQSGGTNGGGGGTSGSTNAGPLPPPGYQLAFDDEFDGPALDTTRWAVLSGPRRDAVATPAAVTVANGLLTLTTYTEDGVHHTGFVTNEGLFAQRYGYWEARIRFHDAPGSWCAFWISAASVDSVGDPVHDGTEIDVVEHRVTDDGGWTELADMVALTVNWDGYGASKKTAQLVSHLPDGSKVQGAWHTYSVLWSPGGYVYYVDGKEVWRPTNAPVSQAPEDVRLTCEVEDASWAGFVPPGGYGSRAASTTKMDVDYVRVWRAPN